jgi:hypothetical protein
MDTNIRSSFTSSRTLASYSEINSSTALVMNLNPIGWAAFKAAVISHAFYVFLKVLLEYMGNP